MGCGAVVKELHTHKLSIQSEILKFPPDVSFSDSFLLETRKGTINNPLTDVKHNVPT